MLRRSSAAIIGGIAAGSGAGLATRMFERPYVAAASNDSRLLPALRDADSVRVPFSVWELPAVTTKPPLICAFHSTSGGGGAPALGSSSFPYVNFGSAWAAAARGRSAAASSAARRAGRYQDLG